MRLIETQTQRDTSGQTHRPFTLIYPRRTGSRCLRAAGPVLAIVFFYELWARRRRRGASAGPSVQHSLSALVPRRGLTFWGAAGIPFCGLCAWACGPQEYWPNASAGLTVADRPMQWSQARRLACGPQGFGAAVTPPASPSLTSRCCVWAGGPQGFWRGGASAAAAAAAACSAGLTVVDRPLLRISRLRTWTLRSPVHLWLASTPRSPYARWLVR